MLHQTVTALLNEQIAKELYSAYLYLDMANYYGDKGLFGFEHWFYVQTQEERDHAMLFRTYLMNNGEKVVLLPIDAPAEQYKVFIDPLTKSLAHEQLVTASINSIYEAASASKDYRTVEFLSWFIKEQGEEEKNVSDLITRYELFGSDPKGLYDLDKDMLTRIYAAPTLVLT